MYIASIPSIWQRFEQCRFNTSVDNLRIRIGKVKGKRREIFSKKKLVEKKAKATY